MWAVDGLRLFLLGRRLMKLGKQAIPPSGFRRLPTSVRSVMIDVFEHPGSSVGEIVERTGFPQSHVSASVTRLRDGGVLVSEPDPADRRRTLVRAGPDVAARAARVGPGAVEPVLAAEAPGVDVAELGAALDRLADLLLTSETP